MSDVTLWWLTLGSGFVVLIIAVTLLRMFVSQLRKIEREVEAIWQVGKQLAANTATTWQLQQASERAHALGQEITRHRDLLVDGSSVTAPSHAGPDDVARDG